MVTDLQLIQAEAKEKSTENEKFRKSLLHIPVQLIDEVFHPIAAKFTIQMDCKSCGNCCKELEPEISKDEIKNLESLALQKGKDWNEEVVNDEANDLCFMKAKPCIFLEEKICSIYAQRPSSCADYPHLHHPRVKYMMNRILDQYGVCPIVYNSVEALKTKLHTEMY